MKKALLFVSLIASFALSAAEPEYAATVDGAKKAAAFLIAQQNENGTFGKSSGAPMPGMVGLVVKSLASSPEKFREANPALDKAVKFLLSKQLPNGSITDPKFSLDNYNTSLSIIALAALQNPAYQEVLEKAKKFVQTCQLDEELGYNPKEHGRAYGGFGYGNSKRADLSNTGFSLEALKALGVKEDSPSYKNAILFIKRSQDNDETNDQLEMKGENNSGGFVYLPGDSEFGTITSKSGKKLPKPYGNMSYMAIKSLIYCGMKMDDSVLQAAFKYVKNNYSVEKQPGGDGNQGYYYYVNVFAKAFTASGLKELELADGKKVNWAKDLSTQLLKMQKADGSFVNDAPRWMEGDAVLSTAYALDALNLCVEALK